MAKKAVIYFAKVNIITGKVFDLYNGEDIHDILQPVLIRFTEALGYRKEYSYFQDDKVVEDYINYSVKIKEKSDTYIWGYLSKESKVPYKEEDVNGELRTKYIQSLERIEFYYDIFKEKIGYYTTNRFGKTEVIEVFENMLNRMYDEECFQLMFSVSKYTHGINIKHLQKELEEIRNIHKLKFTFRPANPDSDLLKAIQEKGKEKLEEFENANLSTKHVELTAATSLGLNLKANMVQEEIKYAEKINSNIPLSKSTQNGYVKIEAIGKNGVTYSTEDQAQVKKEISNVIEFKKACQRMIDRGM